MVSTYIHRLTLLWKRARQSVFAAAVKKSLKNQAELLGVWGSLCAEIFNITLLVMFGAWYFYAHLSNELWWLARDIYWEASAMGESWLGQKMAGHVVVGRAMDNLPKWGGSNILDVIRYHGKGGHAQFSWVDDLRAQGRPKNLWRWTQAIAAARYSMEYPDEVPENLKRARYYFNPCENIKGAYREWFNKKLPYLDTVGHHQFYGDPQKGEVIGPAPSANCSNYKIQKQTPPAAPIPMKEAEKIHRPPA